MSYAESKEKSAIWMKMVQTPVWDLTDELKDEQGILSISLYLCMPSFLFSLPFIHVVYVAYIRSDHDFQE